MIQLMLRPDPHGKFGKITRYLETGKGKSKVYLDNELVKQLGNPPLISITLEPDAPEE